MPTPHTRDSHPVYEHPWFVRFCHWTNAVALSVLVASGLMIFSAFPSFGPKLPERDLIDGVPPLLTLGGWLGGTDTYKRTMWAAVPDVALARAGYALTMRRGLPEPGAGNQLIQQIAPAFGATTRADQNR